MTAEYPFVTHLGIQRRMSESGLSEVVLAPLPEHLNSFGVVHGGVLMTLLDVAMAAAARSLQAGMGVVTIEMKTSFLRPARGPLSSAGRVLQRGATLCFTEASISDQAGRVCARASGTFKYVRRQSAAARLSTETATQAD
jgi:uncharacterized protein (TIGR00369 family)